jgi:hypothetical protein
MLDTWLKISWWLGYFGSSSSRLPSHAFLFLAALLLHLAFIFTKLLWQNAETAEVVIDPRNWLCHHRFHFRYFARLSGLAGPVLFRSILLAFVSTAECLNALALIAFSFLSTFLAA